MIADDPTFGRFEDTPPASVPASPSAETPRCVCGHRHETVTLDGTTSVFHRCRAKCTCNEFRPSADGERAREPACADATRALETFRALRETAGESEAMLFALDEYERRKGRAARVSDAAASEPLSTEEVMETAHHDCSDAVVCASIVAAGRESTVPPISPAPPADAPDDDDPIVPLAVEQRDESPTPRLRERDESL